MDTCLRVGHLLRIVDQLLQILDGVDALEMSTPGVVTDLGDPRRDLGTGQVATLTGLGAPGELDLQAPQPIWRAP